MLAGLAGEWGRAPSETAEANGAASSAALPNRRGRAAAPPHQA
ncbi:hypothetical protein BSIN_0997 [Burkholderia singularis]|uniref:Uncharacterized protein n=1 Tax=Burkholderia singularis TaxID=1503053 RepID=A0A238HC05_9BURK|nr:hypothetical protein BSIN_0997 [Burkholderia singularis]